MQALKIYDVVDNELQYKKLRLRSLEAANNSMQMPLEHIEDDKDFWFIYDAPKNPLSNG